MKVWSFYDPGTGEISPVRYGGVTSDHLAANTPAGFVPIEGTFDAETQRVNLDTGEVEVWRDPRPSDAHTWDGGAWRLPAAAAIAGLRAQILELEAEQARPLREIAIARAHGEAAPTAAVDRLLQIEQRAAALRAEISKHKENP